MGNRELEVEVNAIRRSGDEINKAVMEWIDVIVDLQNAWIDTNALGIYGEPARMEYDRARALAKEKLNEANTGLIAVREALYQVAHNYAGAEAETQNRISGINPETRTHRSDIDRPAL